MMSKELPGLFSKTPIKPEDYSGGSLSRWLSKQPEGLSYEAMGKIKGMFPQLTQEEIEQIAQSAMPKAISPEYSGILPNLFPKRLPVEKVNLHKPNSISQTINNISTSMVSPMMEYVEFIKNNPNYKNLGFNEWRKMKEIGGI